MPSFPSNAYPLHRPPLTRPISAQGLPKDERGSVGRVPVPVAVELREDLVGCCSPGDVITVVRTGGGADGKGPQQQAGQPTWT